MIQLDASKTAGALIGPDVAQIIVSSLQYFWHIPVNDATVAAITGICVFVTSHLIPSSKAPQ